MWVRKSFLERDWERRQREKEFKIELLVACLLGGLALLFYQKSLWNIVLFINDGGFIYILAFIGMMYLYYRGYVVHGSLRSRPDMICLGCGKGFDGSDDGWGFKVYGNVKPKFFQFSACGTPDLCDIEYLHLCKWRTEKQDGEVMETEEVRKQAGRAGSEPEVDGSKVETFNPETLAPENDPIPLPKPYSIPNLGEKPAISHDPEAEVSTYTFGDYPYSIVDDGNGRQTLYVGNTEVAESMRGIFEFHDSGKKFNVYCRDRGGKKQIEVVCEGVLVFRGLPDTSRRWVSWVVCFVVAGFLIAFLVI